jgi:uncharacterized protein YjbJ (UPF0337 family)
MTPSPTLKIASAMLLRRNHPQIRNDIAMNKDVISGHWKQVKGKAQARWGDLTDDVFDVAEGDATYLTGKLQEQYGWDRDRAESEVRDFERTLQS